jgi:hypothetical protein
LEQVSGSVDTVMERMMRWIQWREWKEMQGKLFWFSIATLSSVLVAPPYLLLSRRHLMLITWIAAHIYFVWSSDLTVHTGLVVCVMGRWISFLALTPTPRFIGKEHVILGYSWLQKHNPEINWETKEVRITRCPTGCRTCRDELHAVQRNEKLATSILWQLREGLSPSICAVDSEEWHRDEGYNPADGNNLPGLSLDSDDDSDNKDELEEVFAPVEEIRAGSTGSTILQCLAEAHARNSMPARTKVLPWAADFSDVFNRESFDSLPERRAWDHTIELIPDAKPANCKVYPISPLEQKELDAFIAVGLSTGRICLCKSVMASPVFFIKKKDSALRVVQDYQVLNMMTMKDWYPLSLINDLINRLKGAQFFTKLDTRWGFNNV